MVRKPLGRMLKFTLTLLALGATADLAQAQELRISGGSGPFTTNTLAAFASLSDVSKVYRVCATGGAINTGTCAGAAAIGGKGVLQDWIAIEGTLKNCGATCNTVNLGRNGGGPVRIFVAAGGAGPALASVSTTPGQVGFASVFGWNGVSGGGDDPGADGNGAVGVPAGWPSPSATPPINLGTLNRAALVQCATGLKATFVDTLPVAIRPTWSVTPTNELCIVEIDADGNGQINNLATGAPLPRTIIAGGGNETSNLRQNADVGSSPIPPQDFNDPAFSSLTLNQPVTTGLQILKLVVNKNVRAKNDVNKKVSLGDPQIEGIFGGASFGNACSWSDVGGQVVGDPAGKITVVFRETGSAVRQVLRNTFLRNAAGSTPEGSTPGTFDCENFDEAGGGTTTITQKQYIQVGTNGDQILNAGGGGLAVGTLGGISYVNASRTNSTTYSVPIFGIDPDAQTLVGLRKLVKCGQYPFHGPLTVARGPGTDPLGLRQAFVNAISSEVVFNESSIAADYLPFGDFDSGVAYSKDFTAGAYFVKFKPSDCSGLEPVPPLPPL